MIGDFISAGAKLIGGFLDRDAQREANNLALQDKERDRALQREFAQSGIQWRVEDAKKAGIHPLFALGGSGATYSPSAISVGSASMGDAVASMGQDISRAVNSTRTGDQREAAFNDAVRSLTLKKMGLENDLLAAQIQKFKVNANPPMPGGDYLIPGQGQTLVPKADKFEERPRLAVGGREWATHGGWSNAEDFEKRYGDDGPPSWIFNALIAWNDYKKNVQSGDFLDRAARVATGRAAPRWAHDILRRSQAMERR